MGERERELRSNVLIAEKSSLCGHGANSGGKSNILDLCIICLCLYNFLTGLKTLANLEFYPHTSCP